MADPTLTVVASGNWTDFSAPATLKPITPSEDIPIGDVAFFVHGTTVDGGHVATITGCANNGSGLIRVTAATHGFSTGDKAGISGVVGTTEANAASWTLTVIDVNTFDLQGSTFANAYVSGGTASSLPGDKNWGGIIVLSDDLGNTWTRDAWGPVSDSSDSGTTVEIWRCDVTVKIPAAGFNLVITPDTRGMSNNYFLIHATNMPTNSFDQTARLTKSGFNSNWGTGTTPTTTQAKEVVLGVVGSGTASSITTQPGGWTALANYSGSASGSAKATAVAWLLTSVTGTQAGTFTSLSNGSAGAGAIATYKTVGVAPPVVVANQVLVPSVRVVGLH